MGFVRTNVVIDERLVRKAMRLYGFRTKRETIDYALRRLVGSDDPRSILELEGIGWEGDLDEMRGGDVPDLRDISES
jgi:Arc/MetJ family transcription regulator